MMRTGGVNISDSPAFAGADYYSYKQKGCAIAAQPQPVEKEISFCQNAREQPRKLARAQAAWALPFPFGRKRKQKGPFCTALRQREDGDTLKAVRRTFPNSTIHIVSNTWEGSFLSLPCAAGTKIPSRATQSDSVGAASAFRKPLNAQSAAGNARFLQPFVT